MYFQNIADKRSLLCLAVEISWWGKLDNEHLIIIIAIVVGAIVMVLIVCIIIIIVCRRKRAEDKCK
jgi:heme/copper-type cytochrome/quinol oxidase subunit 2